MPAIDKYNFANVARNLPINIFSQNELSKYNRPRFVWQTPQNMLQESGLPIVKRYPTITEVEKGIVPFLESPAKSPTFTSGKGVYVATPEERRRFDEYNTFVERRAKVLPYLGLFGKFALNMFPSQMAKDIEKKRAEMAKGSKGGYGLELLRGMKGVPADVAGLAGASALSPALGVPALFGLSSVADIVNKERGKNRSVFEPDWKKRAPYWGADVAANIGYGAIMSKMPRLWKQKPINFLNVAQRSAARNVLPEFAKKYFGQSAKSGMSTALQATLPMSLINIARQKAENPGAPWLPTIKNAVVGQVKGLPQSIVNFSAMNALLGLPSTLKSMGMEMPVYKAYRQQRAKEALNIAKKQAEGRDIKSVKMEYPFWAGLKFEPKVSVKYSPKIKSIKVKDLSATPEAQVKIMNALDYDVKKYNELYQAASQKKGVRDLQKTIETGGGELVSKDLSERDHALLNITAGILFAPDNKVQETVDYVRRAINTLRLEGKKDVADEVQRTLEKTARKKMTFNRQEPLPFQIDVNPIAASPEMKETVKLPWEQEETPRADNEYEAEILSTYKQFTPQQMLSVLIRNGDLLKSVPAEDIVTRFGVEPITTMSVLPFSNISDGQINRIYDDTKDNSKLSGFDKLLAYTGLLQTRNIKPETVDKMWDDFIAQEAPDMALQAQNERAQELIANEAISQLAVPELTHIPENAGKIILNLSRNINASPGVIKKIVNHPVVIRALEVNPEGVEVLEQAIANIANNKNYEDVFERNGKLFAKYIDPMDKRYAELKPENPFDNYFVNRAVGNSALAQIAKEKFEELKNIQEEGRRQDVLNKKAEIARTIRGEYENKYIYGLEDKRVSLPIDKLGEVFGNEFFGEETVRRIKDLYNKAIANIGAEVSKAGGNVYPSMNISRDKLVSPSVSIVVPLGIENIPKEELRKIIGAANMEKLPDENLMAARIGEKVHESTPQEEVNTPLIYIFRADANTAAALAEKVKDYKRDLPYILEGRDNFYDFIFTVKAPRQENMAETQENINFLNNLNEGLENATVEKFKLDDITSELLARGDIGRYNAGENVGREAAINFSIAQPPYEGEVLGGESRLARNDEKRAQAAVDWSRYLNENYESTLDSLHEELYGKSLEEEERDASIMVDNIAANVVDKGINRNVFGFEAKHIPSVGIEIKNLLNNKTHLIKHLDFEEKIKGLDPYAYLESVIAAGNGGKTISDYSGNNEFVIPTAEEYEKYGVELTPDFIKALLSKYGMGGKHTEGNEIYIDMLSGGRDIILNVFHEIIHDYYKLTPRFLRGNAPEEVMAYSGAKDWYYENLRRKGLNEMLYGKNVLPENVAQEMEARRKAIEQKYNEDIAKRYEKNVFKKEGLKETRRFERNLRRLAKKQKPKETFGEQVENSPLNNMISTPEQAGKAAKAMDFYREKVNSIDKVYLFHDESADQIVAELLNPERYRDTDSPRFKKIVERFEKYYKENKGEVNALPPVPENKNTILAQVEALKDGRKPMVLVTKGGYVPTIAETGKGIGKVKTPAGMVLFRRDAHKPLELKKAFAGNKYGKLLGLSQESKPEGDYTRMEVVTAFDKNGYELASEIVMPEQKEKAIKALAKIAGDKAGVVEMGNIKKAAPYIIQLRLADEPAFNNRRYIREQIAKQSGTLTMEQIRNYLIDNNVDEIIEQKISKMSRTPKGLEKIRDTIMDLVGKYNGEYNNARDYNFVRNLVDRIKKDEELLSRALNELRFSQQPMFKHAFYERLSPEELAKQFMIEPYNIIPKLKEAETVGFDKSEVAAKNAEVFRKIIQLSNEDKNSNKLPLDALKEYELYTDMSFKDVLKALKGSKASGEQLSYILSTQNDTPYQIAATELLNYDKVLGNKLLNNWDFKQKLANHRVSKELMAALKKYNNKYAKLFGGKTLTKEELKSIMPDIDVGAYLDSDNLSRKTKENIKELMLKGDVKARTEAIFKIASEKGWSETLKEGEDTVPSIRRKAGKIINTLPDNTGLNFNNIVNYAKQAGIDKQTVETVLKELLKDENYDKFKSNKKQTFTKEQLDKKTKALRYGYKMLGVHNRVSRVQSLNKQGDKAISFGLDTSSSEYEDMPIPYNFIEKYVSKEFFGHPFGGAFVLFHETPDKEAIITEVQNDIQNLFTSDKLGGVVSLRRRIIEDYIGDDDEDAIDAVEQEMKNYLANKWGKNYNKWAGELLYNAYRLLRDKGYKKIRVITEPMIKAALGAEPPKSVTKEVFGEKAAKRFGFGKESALNPEGINNLRKPIKVMAYEAPTEKIDKEIRYVVGNKGEKYIELTDDIMERLRQRIMNNNKKKEE